MDSGVILMDFEVLFGGPRGLPGAPFSDLARPEAARAEKKMDKTWFQRHYGCMREFCWEPGLARRVFL